MLRVPVVWGSTHWSGQRFHSSLSAPFARHGEGIDDQSGGANREKMFRRAEPFRSNGAKKGGAPAMLVRRPGTTAN